MTHGRPVASAFIDICIVVLVCAPGAGVGSVTVTR